MKSQICKVVLLAIGLLMGLAPAHGSTPAKAFAQLASLVGEWTGIESGIPVIVTYKVIANGSVLMQETRPAHGPARLTMLTMFSVDGDHLIATHYCDAKNQPQMATKAITDPEMKSFAFSLIRITGMKTPGDWHNSGVEIILTDKNHMIQKWTYMQNGKSGMNVFHLTRMAT